MGTWRALGRWAGRYRLLADRSLTSGTFFAPAQFDAATSNDGNAATNAFIFLTRGASALLYRSTLR
jgi:hypothetical protein